MYELCAGAGESFVLRDLCSLWSERVSIICESIDDNISADLITFDLQEDPALGPL